jgi:hypothetical protein
VVVIYFFHTNYAKYMLSLLLYLYNSAPGEGHRPVNKNNPKRNVHSKQSSTTRESRVNQTTLTPLVGGVHNVFNDWVKKLGSLLSASRSR